MNNFSELSEIQKERFKEISGYDYLGEELQGKFKTDRPRNREWDLSPWLFSFTFQLETGYLFCELSHRMTENQTFGWDFEGNEISQEIIEQVFPRYF